MHDGHAESNVYFGQKPGAGTYHCANCGEEVELADGECLPRCPVCGGTQWEP